MWHFSFAETETKMLVFQLKLISALIKYTTEEIIAWVSSFSLLGIVTQNDCLSCLMGLEGVTEVDTDPKGRFVPFKVTPSNDSSLCLCLFRAYYQGTGG